MNGDIEPLDLAEELGAASLILSFLLGLVMGAGGMFAARAIQCADRDEDGRIVVREAPADQDARDRYCDQNMIVRPLEVSPAGCTDRAISLGLKEK